jgi:hypothetical protein
MQNASIASAVINSKPVGWFTAATGVTVGFIDAIDPLIRSCVGLAGLVLTIVMIRAHWLNGNKAQLEAEAIKRKIDLTYTHEELDNGKA